MLQYIIFVAAVHIFRYCSTYFYIALHIFTMLQYLYSDVALYIFFHMFVMLHLKCFVLCETEVRLGERVAFGDQGQGRGEEQRTGMGSVLF